MPVSRKTRYFTTAGLVLGLMALGYASAKSLNWNLLSEIQTQQVPAIPSASPLASPKSLTQVGVPVQATRSAVTTDNPQTPEKVTLSKHLFFDARLSVEYP